MGQPVLRLVYYPDGDDRAECFHVDLQLTDQSSSLDDHLIWKRLLHPAWTCIAERISEPLPVDREAALRMLAGKRRRGRKFYFLNKAASGAG